MSVYTLQTHKVYRKKTVGHAPLQLLMTELGFCRARICPYSITRTTEMFFQYMHNPINSLSEHTQRTVYTEPENAEMFLKYTLESNITPFLSTPYTMAFNVTQFQITDSNRYLAALLLWMVKTVMRSTKEGKDHKVVETITMPLSVAGFLLPDPGQAGGWKLYFQESNHPIAHSLAEWNQLVSLWCRHYWEGKCGLPWKSLYTEPGSQSKADGAEAGG